MPPIKRTGNSSGGRVGKPVQVVNKNGSHCVSCSCAKLK